MKNNFMKMTLVIGSVCFLISCTKDKEGLLAKTNQDKVSPATVDVGIMPGKQFKIKSWVVPLLGSAEVPAVVSPIIGEARCNLYLNGTFTYNIILKNVPPLMTITAAHIHMGLPGTSGSVVIPLYAPGVGTLVSFGIQGGRITIPAHLWSNLKDNIDPLYINVHSDAHPGGEVRGQLQLGTP